MKCFITTFNHRSWPERMLPDVRRLGLEPVLFDNGSTWPPMVDWLAAVDCEVIRPGGNHSCHGFFNLGLHRQQSEPFIHTDCDLDLSRVPPDAVDRLIAALQANPDVSKAGLSLEWTDLPDHYQHKAVAVEREAMHWLYRRPGYGWHAGIDTTFALYDPARFSLLDRDFYNAVRLDRPYTARHRPWYLDLDRLDEETAFAFRRSEGPVYYSLAARKRMESTQ